MNDIAIQTKGEVRSSTVLTPTKRRGDRSYQGMWVPLKNEPGEMMRIDKNFLTIDPRYQRRLDEMFVGRIAANWSWVSCGALEVSKRPGDPKWFVFEGQHRLRAAMLVPEIVDIPCISFQLDTVRDEAIGFLAANTERKTPTVRDRFKALLMAGDPIAHKIDALVTSYSREIGVASNAQQITCVSALAAMMQDNAAAMERVFPVVADVCAGQPITAQMLRAFHWLERCMPRGESLSDQKYFHRAQRVGYSEITLSIREARALTRKTGSAVYATGLMRALNKGTSRPLVVNLDVVRR